MMNETSTANRRGFEMTDKELLELAAKAAGYDVKPHGNYKHSPNLIFTYQGSNWNPLTDDGDALRLAMRLHLFDSRRLFEIRLIETRANPVRNGVEIMRRAIVRAAAELGKGMK